MNKIMFCNVIIINNSLTRTRISKITNIGWPILSNLIIYTVVQSMNISLLSNTDKFVCSYFLTIRIRIKIPPNQNHHPCRFSCPFSSPHNHRA